MNRGEEVFNKELKKMKKNQTEMKNTITESKEIQAVNDGESEKMQKTKEDWLKSED